MNTKDIVSLIKGKLRKGQICEEWYLKALENDSLRNLCEMWFDGSDWSIRENFPTFDVLKSFKGETEKYGLFMDAAGEITPLIRMAFFGDSDVKIKLSKFDTVQIYLRHNSRLELITDETCIVELNVVDNAKYTLWGDGKVNVYKLKT